MPNESSCGDEHLLLVTEKSKSKVTRKCDLGQVDVLEEGVDDPIHVLEEEQFQQRIPHIVPRIIVDT